MSLNFKYIPLTFLNDVNIIKEQIKNTVILRYLFDEYGGYSKLENLITGTQYGYNASALQSGKNKFLRISDITDGKVDWDTVPFCDCSDEDTYLLNKNDLLIARTGGTTGKSFIIDNPPEKAIFAGYLIKIRANQENNPEFLNLFLNSYVYWSQVVSLNKGEFRPSVNATKLKDLIVPKIAIEIQKDAVKISKGFSVNGFEELENNIKRVLNDFEKSQEIIEQIRSQEKSVELLKQSILQEAIQGKLTANWRAKRALSGAEVEPASELLKRIKTEKAQLIKDKLIKKEKALPSITAANVPFELPEGWVWCRLGEITTYGSSEKIDSQEIKPDTWVLDLEDIEKESSRILQFKTFSERPSLSTKSVFKKGWVLYSKLRPYLDKVVVVPKDGVCTTEILPLPVYSNLTAGYFLYTLKEKHFLSYVNSKVGGMKMPRLGTDDGKMALIPIAPVEEQQVIVEKVESLMQKCQVLEQEIKTSEANAQMLMQAVLKEAFQPTESSDKAGEGKREVLKV